MDKNKKFYISSAIVYASGTPHIGNLYEIVFADTVARFKRQQGYDVYYQTGADEHGLKIETKAKEAGVNPQEFVDKISGNVMRIYDKMNVKYDKFVRTTDPVHKKKVQEIFRKLYDQGDIYKGEYSGMYCTPCESFFTESQLVDGKCPDCGREVKPAKEEAYFFRMSKYADRLMKYIEEHPDFVTPESRKIEMINNFIKPGLQDLCISRSTFKWGVPVDIDEKHVIYVWIDALSNYITFLGYDVNGNHGEAYKKYWPADLHLVGKDIFRFHTIYWPILLMALGEPLPHKIFGHPWLLCGNDKMSKSKGNVLYADDLVALYGVDAVRYYLLHEMPYMSDGTITHELIIERINSELANILGNLVNRTIAMTERYFGGIVPSPSESDSLDEDLKNVCLGAVKGFEQKIDQLKTADAIDEILNMLRRANKYIDETTPWVLAKDDASKPRLATVLYNLLESIRFAAVLFASIMPETSEKIFSQLGTDIKSWDSIQSFGKIEPGKHVGEASILFGRIDPKLKAEEIKNLMETTSAQNTEQENASDKKSLITIDDFDKVELKVAEVIACEPVEKAKKLLKLTVNLGNEQRTVVSGIALWYKPEDLIGKKVVMVTNLKPVTLRGVESCGMILAADGENDSAKVVFAPDVAPGSSIC